MTKKKVEMTITGTTTSITVKRKTGMMAEVEVGMMVSDAFVMFRPANNLLITLCV